jgi:oligoribonuclease
MKYVSLDIKTTGLNPREDQVIEFAMVIEDTENIQPLKELPHIVCSIKHARVEGSFYAINMNHGLIKYAQESGIPPFMAWVRAYRFLKDNGLYEDGAKPFIAGKNVGGFDLQFLPVHLTDTFHHRTIDPGSVFMDWEKGPQSLGHLLGRAVQHTALDDARDVIEVLRRAYT